MEYSSVYHPNKREKGLIMTYAKSKNSQSLNQKAMKNATLRSSSLLDSVASNDGLAAHFTNRHFNLIAEGITLLTSKLIEVLRSSSKPTSGITQWKEQLVLVQKQLKSWESEHQQKGKGLASSFNPIVDELTKKRDNSASLEAVRLSYTDENLDRSSQANILPKYLNKTKAYIKTNQMFAQKKEVQKNSNRTMIRNVEATVLVSDKKRQNRTTQRQKESSSPRVNPTDERIEIYGGFEDKQRKAAKTDARKNVSVLEKRGDSESVEARMPPSPEIRVHQQRTYQTLREGQGQLGKVKPSERPMRDGNKMNELQFKIDQQQQKIAKIKSKMDNFKREQQSTSQKKSVSSLRQSPDRIKLFYRGNQNNGIINTILRSRNDEVRPGQRSNSEEPIPAAVFYGDQSKQQSGTMNLIPLKVDKDNSTRESKESHGLRIEQNSSRDASIHHDHGSGPCNCREKLFQIKKKLRVDHIQRRKTLRANGIVVKVDEKPEQLPQLNSQQSTPDQKFNMKSQFKVFERRLSKLADTALDLAQDGRPSLKK